MKFVVEHSEALEVGVRYYLLLSANEPVEGSDVVAAGADRGDPYRCAFQRLADKLGVLHGGRADTRDERAELRHDLHKALVAQSCQSLADRRAADAEPQRELVLGDALAGLELGGDDRLAQRGVDLAARGTGVQALRASNPHVGHRCILTYK
jgi:hypothetical protein